jgi:hypothetical protein
MNPNLQSNISRLIIHKKVIQANALQCRHRNAQHNGAKNTFRFEQKQQQHPQHPQQPQQQQWYAHEEN